MSSGFQSELSKLVDAVILQAGATASESLRETIAELRQRLSGIERRLAILENIERTGTDDDALMRSEERICDVCDRRAIARGLCSAHYQQWRYRQKKAKLRESHARSALNHFPGRDTERSVLDEHMASEELSS